MPERSFAIFAGGVGGYEDGVVGVGEVGNNRCPDIIRA